MKYDKLQVATIGKVVGLFGDLKLYIESDFIEQFEKGANFLLCDGSLITIDNYDKSNSLVRFVGYQTREVARKLTNQKIYTTVDETKKRCQLNKGEFFWFDVIGSKVYDEELFLGTVNSIERIGKVDYLIVKTEKKLVGNGYVKQFYIPYIDVYVKKFDIDKKIVYTDGGLLLLEAS